MKRLSLCFTGAALLVIAISAHAQTSAPHDSLAAHADSTATAAQADTVAAGATPTSPGTAPSTAAAPTSTAPPPAAAPATATTEPAQTNAAAKPSGLMGMPIYVGGTVGFSFWGDYMRISLEPFVGYKLSQKLSVGGKLRYEYLKDNRGTFDYTAHNFGASALANYWLTKQIYAHGELAMMNYDYPTGNETVPFLLVGGGYSKTIRPGVSAYAEVTWDLINDSNSPYDAGQPMVSLGVAAGF